MKDQVIIITLHEDFELCAHDASGDGEPRLLFGVPVQPDGSREEAVHAVVDAVRDRLLELFNDEE